LDEEAYLRVIQERLARVLSSHERRIVRGCFSQELPVHSVVKLLHSRVSFISRNKAR